MSKKKNKQSNKQPPQENKEVPVGQPVMELPMRAKKVAPAAPVQEEKIDFDAWYVMREAKISKAHHKEIIKADFKGRGLSQHESLKDFDAALAKYGVKLA